MSQNIVDLKDFESRCGILADHFRIKYGSLINIHFEKPDECILLIYPIQESPEHLIITIYYNKVTKTAGWCYGRLHQEAAKNVN